MSNRRKSYKGKSKTGSGSIRQPARSQPRSQPRSDKPAETDPNTGSNGFGYLQTGATAYVFLTLCVAAQAATILISWPVWQIRTVLPNLPWIHATPQFPCGILLLLTLAGVLVSPRRYGMKIHLVALFGAIAMDQFRCQPQVLSLALMMAACVWPSAKRFCYWYLIAMWGWAGLHKLISPDWLGSVAFHLLSHRRIGLAGNYMELAIGIAVAEVILALVAWIRPRIAALLCVAMHIGIVVFLLIIQWNYSVIPWNLCSAAIGAWVLWTASAQGKIGWPISRTEAAIAVILLVLPATFYLGTVRHCFAHVLYSGNLPQAVITYNDRVMPLKAIDDLTVPFPHTHKAYRDYFFLTGRPGEKLHVRDPRRQVNDRYYVLSAINSLNEISRSEFLSTDKGSVVGVEQDDRRAIFQLSLANVNLLQRSADEMVYAVRFDPGRFSPELLHHLKGLPNVEQIELADCKVADDDLKILIGLTKLEAIGLNRTIITDRGLEILIDSPRLEIIEHEGTAISEDGMNRFLMEVWRREQAQRSK